MRVLIGFALAGLTMSQPATVHVTVRLLDVRSAKGGVLRVGLHRAPGTGFPGPSELTNQMVRPAMESIVTFDAPPGIFAVAVHHDANTNGRMDANFFGMPKEGYGVSNDVRPKFRAPRFAEAAVQIRHDTTLVVHMAY
ncbi:MAG: DUF2141 domain-containing protein [Gemmatimonadaceae bacterium]|nr:DUF2141 domain-containing protein [Gemmatimonadaceae bacterium]